MVGKRTRTFSELQSHYLFEGRFGRPGKGNNKGNFEGVIGFGRRSFAGMRTTKSRSAVMSAKS